MHAITKRQNIQTYKKNSKIKDACFELGIGAQNGMHRFLARQTKSKMFGETKWSKHLTFKY